MVLSLCGVTPGKGCIYSFDPVGSYERETYRAGGSAAAMLQPLLDNQVCRALIVCMAFCVVCALDWLQESGRCDKRASVQREGSLAGSGRVHGCSRERYLHRGWAPGPDHH